MGTDPMVAAVVLKSLGADMIGTNCSLGPVQLLEIIKTMYTVCDIPLCVKPNAGLPEMINGEAVFKESPGKFLSLTGEYVKYGVRLIGGCCGTTPEHIKAIKTGIEGVNAGEHQSRTVRNAITSGVKLIDVKSLKDMNLGHINTETDGNLLNELLAGNIEAVVDKAIELASEGYDAICVNVDKNNTNLDLLKDVVNTAQAFMREPMIMETANEDALDKALRVYKGKAGVIINTDSDDKYIALSLIAKKYGSTIMA
jgi:5-methyltetrahydrofolate--homocysteine methyltransferase